MPDFGSLIWMMIAIIVPMCMAVGFIVFWFVVVPKIARQMTSAKWKSGVPAFIEDDSANVHFTMSKKQLPEGLIRNKLGWFLLPRPSYRSPYLTTEVETETGPDGKSEKRGPGRPKKVEPTIPDMPEEERKQVMKTLLRVPLLRGLGKQVFFGYIGTALLSNLKTLAHADLRQIRELVPLTIQKTQLDALATGSRWEGIKMRGGETMKMVIIALCVIGPIAVTGIIAYLLISRPV